ncbi:MAG: hypothetical protein ABI885_05030 [Gammaproteobacteria bacterium]
MTKRIIAHLTQADAILGGVIHAVGGYKLETDLTAPPNVSATESRGY